MAPRSCIASLGEVNPSLTVRRNHMTILDPRKWRGTAMVAIAGVLTVTIGCGADDPRTNPEHTSVLTGSMDLSTAEGNVHVDFYKDSVTGKRTGRLSSPWG